MPIDDVRNFNIQFPTPGCGSDLPAAVPGIIRYRRHSHKTCNLETTHLFLWDAQIVGLYDALDPSCCFRAAWCQYSVRSSYECALVETTHPSTSSLSVHFSDQALCNTLTVGMLVCRGLRHIPTPGVSRQRNIIIYKSLHSESSNEQPTTTHSSNIISMAEPGTQ